MPASTDARPAPPLSLTTCWDKAKWHHDAEDFPGHLPREAGRAHILMVLGFLEERGWLTNEGRIEARDRMGEDTSLLAEHVRKPAQGFLDECYAAYLDRCAYGEPPAVEYLEQCWNSYEGRYDLKKRIRPDPYQALLLAAHPNHTLEDALRGCLHDPEKRLPQLREALPHAPEAEGSLLQAVLDIYDHDAQELAAHHPQPGLLLQALQYLESRRHGIPRLRAAAVLARRLALVPGGVRRRGLLGRLFRPAEAAPDPDHLISLLRAANVWRPNAETEPEIDSDPAWRALSLEDRDLLAAAVNLAYRQGPNQHLAVCAMRTVGDERSLQLLDQEPPDCSSTIQYSDGRAEPSIAPVMREARAAIEGRLQLGGP